MLWYLQAEVHAFATSQYNPMDTPMFAVAVQNPSSSPSSSTSNSNHTTMMMGDTILVFQPESSSPIASITLTTNVVALAWGRESVRLGRRACIFALTERREVIKIVDGEVVVQEKEEEKEEEEEETAISAFDEVFDVDQVEKRAQSIRAETDYSKCEGWTAWIIIRRSAEDKGVFVHSERTYAYASTPFRIVPVFLR